MADNLDNQLDSFFAKIGKRLDTSLNKRSMSLIGNEAIRLMKPRIRAGYGVDRPRGRIKRFEPLSEKYIEKRRRSRLSQYTSPGKSNVTFSGRLIASLRVIRTQDRGLFIGPTGLNVDGKSNEDIARYLAEQGRIFNNISDNELKKLISFYRKRLLVFKK